MQSYLQNHYWRTNYQCASDSYIYDFSGNGYKVQDLTLMNGDTTCFTSGRYHARFWTMADGRVVVGVHHEYFDWGCVCHHVDTWEGAESKLAQDESGQYAGYLGYPQVLTDNRFLNNAGYFGCCSPQPYNDGSATIVGNLVTIQSYPVTDTYSRSHGFSVDQPLPVPWWPPYQSGYEFRVTSTAFTSGQYIWVDSGTHYVEEAASGFVPSYKWHSTIWINGIFGAEADVGRDNHLRVYFTF